MKTSLKNYPQNMIKAIDPVLLTNFKFISPDDIEYVLSLAENEYVKPFALAFYKYGYSAKKIAKAYDKPKGYVFFILSEKLKECIYGNFDILVMGVQQHYTEIGRNLSITEISRINHDHEVEMATLKADYENKIKRLQEKLNVKTASDGVHDLDGVINRRIESDTDVLSSRDLTMLSRAGIETYGDLSRAGVKLTEIKYVNKNTIITLLVRYISHIFSLFVGKKVNKAANSCEGSFMEN